jgi:hypothetical protein
MAYKIWVKYEDNCPIKIVIDKGDVDDLKKAIKKELPSLDVSRISLRKHGEEVDLDPELEINENLVNNLKTPIQILGMYQALLISRYSVYVVYIYFY